MNSQNPGSAVGDCKTPLKSVLISTKKVTMLEAVCASGIATIIMWANELAKMNSCMMKRRTRICRMELWTPTTG